MEQTETKQIEKPWCVYGCLGATLPDGFGKIVEDSGVTYNLLYSESQMYAPDCWDKRYVGRFDTLDEAVDYFIEHKPEFDVRDSPITEQDIRDMARQNFPSSYAAEKI